MGLYFEWDPTKAEPNATVHYVTFEEACTVFEDPLSRTIEDPLHSEHEERFVIIGQSARRRTLVVVHTERGERIRVISVRLATGRDNDPMKQMKNDPDLMEEYDFSGGVRGKYARRFQEGSNVVVIDADVAEYFPDHDSVNDALRSLVEVITRQVKTPHRHGKQGS